MHFNLVGKLFLGACGAYAATKYVQHVQNTIAESESEAATDDLFTGDDACFPGETCELTQLALQSLAQEGEWHEFNATIDAHASLANMTSKERANLWWNLRGEV